MKVLKVILGILLVLAACSILTMPVLASFIICWIVPVFMMISGIIGIIRYVEDKNAEKVAKKNGLPYLSTGVGSLIFGIAAIVIYILTRSSANGMAVFMQVSAILFGVWITLFGISMIVLGVQGKKVAESGWFALIILGVLVAIMGIFCIVNSFAALTTMGTMFAISMMMAGFGLIFS